MADRIVAEPKSIEVLLADGYRIRPKEYLRQGWEIFKRDPTGFLGFALIFTVASQGPLFLTPVFGQFLSVALQVIMMAGIALMVWKRMRTDQARFSDFFPDWDTVGHLILCTIVGSLLIVAGLFLFVLPGIYLIVAYTFSYMLIVDRGLGVWQALEASRRVVGRHWWKVAGLAVIAIVLMAGGTVLASLVLGLPLGAFLSQYYPNIDLSDLPFGPTDSSIVVNLGMMIGVTSCGLIGLGLGTALAGCMYGVAYADIFGLTGRAQSTQVLAEKAPTRST
jgi:hypothetical protein